MMESKNKTAHFFIYSRKSRKILHRRVHVMKCLINSKANAMFAHLLAKDSSFLHADSV